MVFFAHPSPPEVVMARRGRSAALILAALTVCPGMILCFYLPRTEAEPRPSPFRTAQITSPLSPVPMPDHPPVEALGPPTELPSPPGTTCPIDPPTPVVSLRIRVMDSAAVGQPLEYHICLRNESCAPAYHVQVRNPLPAHARFLRATPEPSTREPELLWHLGTLRPQTCSEIILVLEPTGTGDVRNCARVQFEHGQCVTTRIARPRLSLSKTGPSEAALNDVLTFRLTVTNQGGGEVSDIVLTDILDAGLQYVRPGSEEPGNKHLLIWKLGSLPAGRSRTVDYQAVAKATGRLCNRAEVYGAGGVRDAATHCVRVGKADLELLLNGPDETLVGRPANYQLTLSNSGTLTASNVSLTLTLPPGMQFVEASEGGQYADGRVRWLPGTLPAAGRRNFRLRLMTSKPGDVTLRAVATADRSLKARPQN